MKYLLILTAFFISCSQSPLESVVETDAPKIVTPNNTNQRVWETVVHTNNQTYHIPTIRIEYIGDGFLYVQDTTGCGTAFDLKYVNQFYAFPNH